MISTPALTVPLPRVPPPWGRVPSVARSLYLLAQPYGGQRSARQNAWTAMSENAARKRCRVEAEEAVAAAQLGAHVTGSQTKGSGAVGTGPVALETTG